MSVAREALTIVFREHAGLLGSFKDDKRKIMKRTQEIFDECEVVVMELMGEARWEELVNLREITRQRLEKLTTVEDTYMSTWFRHQKTYRKRQSDDRKNEARQLKRRRIKTQPDRIQKALTLLCSEPGGVHFTPQPTTRRMLVMIDEVRYLLPDVTWACEVRDVAPVEWLAAAYKRIFRMSLIDDE